MLLLFVGFFLIGIKYHSHKLGFLAFLEKSDNTGFKCWSPWLKLRSCRPLRRILQFATVLTPPYYLLLPALLLITLPSLSPWKHYSYITYTE